MERLKNLKETLVSCVQGQMTHLDSVDTKELGEVIDMVKDLSEAIYYCTIIKEMEEGEKNKEKMSHSQGPRYYAEPLYPYPYVEDPYLIRDIDRERGRMYYNGNGRSGGSSQGGGGNSGGSSGGSSNSGGSSSGGSGGGGSRQYSERERPIDWSVDLRDYREGRSPRSRKMYMESKEMHHDKTKQMKELEKYMQELTDDILEMIEESSPEEKQYLSSKISTLATKITPGK